MYVVIGATGNTGSIVAERLLAAGKEVRVVARNADKLKSLAARGAEALAGSVDDSSAMSRAFAGAAAAYVMVPPNPATPDLYEYQKRAVEAMASAIESNGVKYVVTLSSIGADLPSGNGPVQGLYYMEQRFNRLGNVNVLHLRPPYFMENQLFNIGLIKQMGINGSAIRADVAVPMIATRDIGEYAAKRLLALDFSGKGVFELQGFGDITMTDATRLMGDAIGRPELSYVHFPYDQAEQGMIGMGLTPDMARRYVELSRAINEGRLKYSQPRTAENTTSVSFAQFAKEVFAPAFSAAQ